MLAALTPGNEAGRPLTAKEFALLDALLLVSLEQHLRAKLGGARVEQMSDGGMGSLRFLHAAGTPRRMGREIVEATYVDEDGVPVEISINVDKDGELFELDMWKANFSPLLSFPEPSQVHLV